MLLRVFKTKWFERYCRKHAIGNESLLEVIHQTEKGLIDVNLGGSVLKQRLARVGQGKSGGHRTILIFELKNKAFFVYGFPKNERKNINRDETESFRKMATHLLSLSDSQLKLLIDRGDLMEVERDDKKI